MITFEIIAIKIIENKYLIDWDVRLSNGEKIDFLKYEPLLIEYAFPLKINYFIPIQIVLGAFVPLFISKYKEIKVQLPSINEDQIIINYWTNYLNEMFGVNAYSLMFEFIKQYQDQPSAEEIFKSGSTNIGLMYGGGVESTFSLSTIYHKKPVLIAVNGDNWMNSDKKKSLIKYSLIKDLTAKYNLNFQEITMNTRKLIKESDIIYNRFCTGNLFYFLSLPIADKYDISTIYLSTELEYALSENHDLSIHPRFIKNIYVNEKNFPLFVALHTAYSKIEMFAELSKTDFIKYIYSCFQNTDKRWCGECSKCFRISEYCDRIGLDKSIIGMQEGITGYRENSDLSVHYWKQMDKYYGKRKFMRENMIAVKHTIKRLNRLKNKLLKIQVAV
ncbi:hypothetical protein K8R14_02060 [bacterium]|nr:hypothetical protein [bacterium]